MKPHDYIIFELNMCYTVKTEFSSLLETHSFFKADHSECASEKGINDECRNTLLDDIFLSPSSFSCGQLMRRSGGQAEWSILWVGP